MKKNLFAFASAAALIVSLSFAGCSSGDTNPYNFGGEPTPDPTEEPTVDPTEDPSSASNVTFCYELEQLMARSAVPAKFNGVVYQFRDASKNTVLMTDVQALEAAESSEKDVTVEDVPAEACEVIAVYYNNEDIVGVGYDKLDWNSAGEKGIIVEDPYLVDLEDCTLELIGAEKIVRLNQTIEIESAEVTPDGEDFSIDVTYFAKLTEIEGQNVLLFGDNTEFSETIERGTYTGASYGIVQGEIGPIASDKIYVTDQELKSISLKAVSSKEGKAIDGYSNHEYDASLIYCEPDYVFDSDTAAFTPQGCPLGGYTAALKEMALEVSAEFESEADKGPIPEIDLNSACEFSFEDPYNISVGLKEGTDNVMEVVSYEEKEERGEVLVTASYTDDSGKEFNAKLFVGVGYGIPQIIMRDSAYDTMGCGEELLSNYHVYYYGPSEEEMIKNFVFSGTVYCKNFYDADQCVANPIPIPSEDLPSYPAVKVTSDLGIEFVQDAEGENSYTLTIPEGFNDEGSINIEADFKAWDKTKVNDLNIEIEKF